jgi:hypothetical protein
MPSRSRQIVDQDHRSARIGDSLKWRQLDVLLRVGDAGTGTIREDLQEGETECLGDGLGNLLAEAIRAARMAAGHARNGIGGSIAPELTDQVGQRFGGSIDQPAIEFSFGAFQRGYIIGFGACPPRAGGNPCDITSSE